MEVTHTNFEEALPLIAESIQSAEFIALDTEFSGTHSLFSIDLTMFQRSLNAPRRQRA